MRDGGTHEDRPSGPTGPVRRPLGWVLALLLGFWVVSGVVELFTALSHRHLPGRGWTALMGVLGIVAGLVVLAYPDG